MRPEILEVVKEWVAGPLLDAKMVLEVGSYDVNGSPRAYFPNADYTGIDMRDGPGVDEVMNAHHLSDVFGWTTFDLVLCFETLEHDPAFWKTMEEMHHVLRVDGLLALSVPTIEFRVYHDYPSDYWRFTKAAITDVLLADWNILDLREICTHPPAVDTIVVLAEAS